MKKTELLDKFIFTNSYVNIMLIMLNDKHLIK